MTLQEREQHAKKVVNDIRHERGLRRLGKLKQGIPKHASSCTIAVSLPAHYVDYSGDFVRADGWQYEDRDLALFMEAYDEGKYPHLEIPKTPVKIKFSGHRKATVIE